MWGIAEMVLSCTLLPTFDVKHYLESCAALYVSLHVWMPPDTSRLMMDRRQPISFSSERWTAFMSLCAWADATDPGGLHLFKHCADLWKDRLPDQIILEV